MHKCSYKASLGWGAKGSFFFDVTANFKGMSAKVMRMEEGGRVMCRYLYYNYYGGWLVCFPGEKMGFYFGYSAQPKQRMSKAARPINISNIEWPTEQHDLAEIAEKRPDIRYLALKYKGSSPKEFSLLAEAYKRHPEIENLVEMGMTSVALSRGLWRMGEEKRKSIVGYIRRNSASMADASAAITGPSLPGQIPIGLGKLEAMQATGRPAVEAAKMVRLGLDPDQMEYVSRGRIEPQDYKDYLKKVREAGHDPSDPYWRLPRRFKQQVRKADAEVRRIRNASLSERFGAGISAFRALSERTAVRQSGMVAYIPYSVSDIEEQAKKLSQCLVRCGYVERMASRDSVLVFVKSEGGERLATAEVDWKKRILQIYADEKNTADRESCQATEAEKAIVSTMLSKARSFRPSAVKAASAS